MKKLTALVLALCMALGLAACGGSKDTGSAAGSTAAASGDTVKIGVYEPQSGDNGAGGKQEILGVQYANSIAPTVEIGGKTYNVKLEIVDNESSNDKAVSAASQLVSQGVSVVLGSPLLTPSRTQAFPPSASPAPTLLSPQATPITSALASSTPSRVPSWQTMPMTT